MTPKERFFATINNHPVDRPATWLGLPTPDAIPGLLEYFKVDSISTLKAKLQDDVWPVIVPYNNAPFNDIGCALNFTKTGKGGTQDERTLTAPGYFEDMTDPAEVDKYPWPNPKDFLDVEEAAKRAKEIPTEYLRMGIMWSAHFQDSCSAFGMENALITMMMYPDMYQAVINRITDFYLETNKIFYEATKGYLDAVLIGNDFGAQAALMVDPSLLQAYVFEGTKKLVDQAKSYGLTVVHHSCGSIFPIIGDLFDMGVDVIHPIQALAADMDVETLQQNFKNRGAFCGGVDAQELLVNGTPEQITAKVAEIKKVFPTGLVISPSHEAILPDINPANIEAMYAAVKKV
jgi:uroporphyrinogen decarboxylase